ncbi:MAG: hypothetical protein ACRCS9_13880 [Hyphomicrobium sp.]
MAKRQDKQEDQEALTTLDEDRAAAIAHGCAMSTFDIVLSYAGDGVKLVPGRFWYCRTQQPSPQEQADHMAKLASFVVAHAPISGEALYLHTASHVAKRRICAWPDLPLAERKAFEVFAAVLPPLVREARVEIAKRRAATEAVVALPDAGFWKRGDGLGNGKRPSFNDQPVLSYSDQRKEAAE